MASTLVITKQSGVLFLSVDGLPARGFFGSSGNYQLSTDGLSVVITIGGYQSVSPALQVSIPCTGLTVGTTVATSGANAVQLLNAIFGT